MRSNVDSILALPKRKAQKLKISDAVHADNLALFRIHPEFQLSLKIPLCASQKPLCRSWTLCQYHNVICIPDDRYSFYQYSPKFSLATEHA